MALVRQPTFPLYDRILGGKLADLLLEWRAQDLSVTEMTWQLRERDCVVSPMTVRRWLEQVEEAAS